MSYPQILCVVGVVSPGARSHQITELYSDSFPLDGGFDCPAQQCCRTVGLRCQQQDRPVVCYRRVVGSKKEAREIYSGHSREVCTIANIHTSWPLTS